MRRFVIWIIMVEKETIWLLTFVYRLLRQCTKKLSPVIWYPLLSSS